MQKPLSAEQAAQLVFRCRQPEPKQIAQINRLLRTGEMRGSRRDGGGPWQTTSEAVAEYLARRATEKACGTSDAASCAAKAISGFKHVDLTRVETGRVGHNDLAATYQNAFKDYFLAVIFRQQRKGRSKRFEHAVLAGQATLLLGFVALCVTIIRPAWTPRPAAHNAVETWIAENTESYKVLQWFPPSDNREGDGQIVRVKYRYRQSRNRSIETDRLFLVNGAQVQVADVD